MSAGHRPTCNSRLRERVLRAALEANTRTANGAFRHLRSCPACQREFEAITEVQYTLALLRNRPMPTGLVNRATARALLVLDPITQDLPACRELQRDPPQPPLRERLIREFAQVARAAGIILLLAGIRVGLWAGVLHATRVFEILAQIHRKTHVTGAEDLLS